MSMNVGTGLDANKQNANAQSNSATHGTRKLLATSCAAYDNAICSNQPSGSIRVRQFEPKGDADGKSACVCVCVVK